MIPRREEGWLGPTEPENTSVTSVNSRDCLKFPIWSNHRIDRSRAQEGRFISVPLKGAVMVSNFKTPGTRIIRYTERTVRTTRIALGSPARKRARRFPGIILGNPPARSIGIPLLRCTIEPATKCWQIRKHSLRYFTTKEFPLRDARRVIRDLNICTGFRSSRKAQHRRRIHWSNALLKAK